MAAKRSFIMMSLLRCGETRWESEDRLHGRTDLPLTAAGRAAVSADITRLAGALIATVYHTADEAASETALMWARATQARTKNVEELADPDLGLLEGLLEQDLADRYPKRHKQWQDDPLSLVPPEGEPILDAQQRILRATARLVKKTRASEIALVLHPVALGLLRCRFADRPAEHLPEILGDGTRVDRYAIPIAWADRLLDPVGVQPVGA